MKTSQLINKYANVPRVQMAAAQDIDPNLDWREITAARAGEILSAESGQLIGVDEWHQPTPAGGFTNRWLGVQTLGGSLYQTSRRAGGDDWNNTVRQEEIFHGHLSTGAWYEPDLCDNCARTRSECRCANGSK